MITYEKEGQAVAEREGEMEVVIGIQIIISTKKMEDLRLITRLI